MNDKPYIHLFKTPGGFYIYDVNTDMILSTNECVYNYLDNQGIINSNDCIDEIKASLSQMIKDGFLSSNRVQEMYHPATDYLKYFLKSKMNMVILQVTQNCNLRCAYCTYSGQYKNRTHSNKVMDFETAKREIDFLINHSMDNNHMSVGFYGGEPLLMFDLIKKCINYTEEAAEGKTLYFNLTSNGTLINQEIIEYFIRHNVRLTLSLDGPRNIQDQNRKFAKSDKGSFDVLYKNIKMIKENYFDYYKNRVGFNMVLDPTLDFSCINNFVLSDDIFNDPIINSGVISQRYRKDTYEYTEDFIEKRNYELFKLFLNKVGKLDGHNVSPLIKNEYNTIYGKRGQKQYIKGQKLADKAHHGGPCIPGALRLFITADGTFYPCEHVSEASETMQIGNLDTGFNIQKIESLLNVGRITAEQCKNCWAFQYCTVCAGMADDLKKLSADLVLKMCPSIRAETENMFKNYCTLREFGDDFSANFRSYDL